MTDVEGNKLAAFAGQTVKLKMDAERIPTWAENVTVQLGKTGAERILVCAHIDSKINTPGAVDNACGVIVLMLLAELLKDQQTCPPVELLVINGEDHYSAGGEMEYLRRHKGKLDSIRLAINIDGAGYKGHPSAVSFYSTPESVEQYAQELLPAYPSIQVGEPWYQSDHMVFAMSQVPTMAITTSAFMEMEHEIAHTPKDTPDRVDITLLEDIARFLEEFILNLDKETYNAA
jgi:aminopeptidase YwaD